MVKGQFRCMEWEGPHIWISRSRNRNKCIPQGLEGLLHGGCYGRSVVPRRISVTHQLSRAPSRSLCNTDLCKIQSSNESCLLMDNVSKSPVLAIDLWEWCLQQIIQVEAQYPPGVLNIRADRESRVMLDLHDWKLDPLVFAELNQLWGALEGDLFASHLSTQLPLQAY